mgnify:CR=1 FL=1
MPPAASVTGGNPLAADRQPGQRWGVIGLGKEVGHGNPHALWTDMLNIAPQIEQNLYGPLGYRSLGCTVGNMAFGQGVEGKGQWGKLVGHLPSKLPQRTLECFTQDTQLGFVGVGVLLVQPLKRRSRRVEGPISTRHPAFSLVQQPL